MIAEKLPSLSDSGSRGTGGLTVADLRHYAGVPARVVVVAGLDDGVFPKSEDRPSWHPLVLKPATGDPSARDSDRHCLLLAILACRERLILSYRGCSDEDGKERPPSTALADLLEAVDQTIAPSEPQADPEVQTAPKATQAPLHESILFHHPLNGFSASAFGADLPHSARGMRSSDFCAAEALLNRKGFPAYPGPWSQSLPAETGWLPTLADLRSVLDQPQRLFASRLGLKLPEETETAPGEDLIDPNGLERWHLRDQLLTARLEGQSLESLVSVLHVSGRLPRGKIGDTVLQKATSELPDLPVFSQNDRLTANLRFPLSDPDSNQSPWLLEGSPRARWYRRPGESAVFQFFASKSHSGSDYRRQLLFAFDALALAASQRDNEPHPLSEARCVGPQATWVLVLPPPIPARAHLGRLVRLARLARRWPLPFWPKTAGVAMKAGSPCPECPPDALLKVLESAYSEWSSDPQDNSGRPDCQLPATRTLFRGCNNPFEWNPEGLPDWLPSSGTPLAWRLMVEIESWRNTLNLSTHE